MPPILAAFICTIGIVGLFVIDPDRRFKSSWTLIFPTIWLLIAGSRHVSFWLDMAPSASPQQYLEGSPVDRDVYLLLLLAGIIVVAGRGKSVLRLLRRNWPLVLFIAYCMLSVLWSDYPGVAMKRWVKSLGDYVMVLIVLTERDWTLAMKRVLSRVGFILIPVSVLFVKYYPQLGRSYAAHWDSTQFFVGVASDKNMLGMICLVLGFAAFCRVLHAFKNPGLIRNKVLLVHGTILLMSLYLLKISDSMTSLSCFAMTAGLVLLHHHFKFAKKPKILFLSVLFVVFFSFAILFLNVGNGLLEMLGRNPTLTGRTDIWTAVLKVPINPVLGTGFESFWLGSRLGQLWTTQELYGINEAHDGYLEMYLNLGGVGLLLLLSLIISGYRNITGVLSRNPEIGHLCLGYFVIALVYDYTEAAFRSTDFVWLSFLLATLAVPVVVRSQRQKESSHFMPPTVDGYETMPIPVSTRFYSR